MDTGHPVNIPPPEVALASPVSSSLPSELSHRVGLGRRGGEVGTWGGGRGRSKRDRNPEHTRVTKSSLRERNRILKPFPAQDRHLPTQRQPPAENNRPPDPSSELRRTVGRCPSYPKRLRSDLAQWTPSGSWRIERKRLRVRFLPENPLPDREAVLRLAGPLALE